MRINKKINNQNLEEWLRSTGFLYPANELELARFNKLYADYDFKLKDVSIDPQSVIEGQVCSFGLEVLQFENNVELQSEFEGLRMVARKGQEIPSHIIDKMTKKHRKKNSGEEE